LFDPTSYKTGLGDVIRLGRPDLLSWRLGVDGQTFGWSEWSDGVWRADVKPLDRRHVAEAVPLAPGQCSIGAITVREYPAGEVAAQMMLDEPLPFPEPDDYSVTFTEMLRAVNTL
jgi:hypothetical protein